MPFEKIINPPLEEMGRSGLGRQIQTLDRVLEKPHAAAPVLGTGLLEAIGRVLWRLSGLSAEEVLHALEEARDDESPCGWWSAVKRPNTCLGSSFIMIIPRSAF